MHCCHHERGASRQEARNTELTRDEQVARRPLSLAQVVLEAGPALFAARHPEALRVIIAPFRPRLSRRDYAQLVTLVEERYGTAFARRAGLPVGPPTLRLAG